MSRPGKDTCGPMSRWVCVMDVDVLLTERLKCVHTSTRRDRSVSLGSPLGALHGPGL